MNDPINLRPFVLAGNREQAGNYAKEQNFGKDWVYIANALDVLGRGLMFVTQIHRVGTWYNRPDLREIETEIHAALRR